MFRRFVRHCGTTGRPLFWQEEAWRRFVVARPEWAVTLDELRAALRFCDRHGGDLVPGPVGVLVLSGVSGVGPTVVSPAAIWVSRGASWPRPNSRVARGHLKRP